MMHVFFFSYQPEMDCTLNNTKVECAVGYPFLASNVEVLVQLHSSVLCLYNLELQ